MEIKILDYKLVQSEHAPERFDLVQTITRTKRKLNPDDPDETYPADICDNYGMSLEHSIEKIIFFELQKHNNTLTLSQFLEEYKSLKNQILNILN